MGPVAVEADGRTKVRRGAENAAASNPTPRLEALDASLGGIAAMAVSLGHLAGLLTASRTNVIASRGSPPSGPHSRTLS